MTLEDIRSEIEERLGPAKRKALNRNALNALFGAFTDPIGSLGTLFLRREDAVDDERHKIESQMVLELLCRMSDAINNLEQGLRSEAPKSVILQGLIETNASNGDRVVGVDIDSDAGTVEFTPGTRISTKANNVKDVTGLRIGGEGK